jgi:hypothetical protein
LANRIFRNLHATWFTLAVDGSILVQCVEDSFESAEKLAETVLNKKWA